MNVLKRTSGLLALAACLVAPAGCGSDEEGAGIPPDAAAVLERQLASIESRFNAGPDACADITGDRDPNTAPVQETIDSLPDDVDPDVRDALQQSFDRLFELVEQQCEEPPPETDTETTPTETETETTDTTETEPPATEPEPTTPTDTGEQTTPTDTGEQTTPGGGGDEGGGLLGGGDGGGALVPEEGDG
jgi:hypothetical protein